MLIDDGEFWLVVVEDEFYTNYIEWWLKMIDDG